MDLGQPARSLVPTVDAPVLLALHATTRPLTGRRLATLAGASHTAVNAILGRLTRAGVVLAERQAAQCSTEPTASTSTGQPSKP